MACSYPPPFPPLPTSCRNGNRCVNGFGADSGESYCDECIDELLARVDWENESFRESSIVCPWCGYEDPDSFEVDEGEHEDFACRRCGKPFDLEVEVSTEYTTRRNIKYMPKGFGVDEE